MNAKGAEKRGRDTGTSPQTRRGRRRGKAAENAAVADQLISLLSEELLTSFPSPLLLYDRRMTIVYANEYAIDCLGFDPSGLSREAMLDRIELHIDDGAKPTAENYISTVSGEGTTVRNIYYQFQNAKGELRTTLGSSAPLILHGDLIGVVVTWQDITELMEEERLIVLAREELENVLAEKTRALVVSEKKLEQSKRLGDIGMLAATVAHELRNPLGVIRTAVYNLRRKNADPALERHIDNIDKKIDESAMIIDNLLNYSKIRAPRIEPVPLAEILAECIESVKKHHRKKQVTISRTLRNLGGLSLMADPEQLREVFRNILNNAVQAVEERGTVRISAARDGESVVIEIADTGEGIDEADIEKVFDPFFTRRAKGTGLGLAICRNLVEMHDGSISIRSERGAGTTVSVKLPLERKDHEPRKHPDHRG